MPELILLVSLFLNPEPSRLLLARAWQAQAHHILALKWAASYGVGPDTKLLCGGLAQLEANASSGAIACYVWPVGESSGAVKIPYVCCPAFFPCREEMGLTAGRCAVFVFPEVL